MGVSLSTRAAIAIWESRPEAWAFLDGRDYVTL